MRNTDCDVACWYSLMTAPTRVWASRRVNQVSRNARPAIEAMISASHHAS